MNHYKRLGHPALPTTQVIKELWQIHLLYLGHYKFKKKSDDDRKLESIIFSESMPIKTGEGKVSEWQEDQRLST